MSKALALLVIGGLGVGAVVLIASTSKASPKSPPAPPAPGPSQFGQATTVQGRSNYVWAVAPMLNPGPVAPGVKVMGVFLARAPTGSFGPTSATTGDLVMTFAQQGADMNARSFVSSPLAGSAVPDQALEAARADFGV